MNTTTGNFTAVLNKQGSRHKVVLTQYDFKTYPGTACEPWCSGDVVIDRAAAEALGRTTFPANDIADDAEKCSWDNMCAGCSFCKTDDAKTASCEEFCALIATPEVDSYEAPWKKATLPWSTVCAWGSCHGPLPPALPHPPLPPR